MHSVWWTGKNWNGCLRESRTQCNSASTNRKYFYVCVKMISLENESDARLSLSTSSSIELKWNFTQSISLNQNSIDDFISCCTHKIVRMIEKANDNLAASNRRDLCFAICRRDFFPISRSICYSPLIHSVFIILVSIHSFSLFSFLVLFFGFSIRMGRLKRQRANKIWLS